MTNNNTTKKLKIIGQESYINQNTGEIETFNVIEQKDSDYNFEKVWLSHILQALDCVGNKKIKIINYFLENKDSQNKVIGTQRKIAQDLSVSLTVVNETIKTLIENNIIKKTQIGVYTLNPNIVFKGTYKNRMNIVLKYRNI